MRKSVLETLEDRLRPQYVGWADQYKAILNALGIPLDMPIEDLDMLMAMWRDAL